MFNCDLIVLSYHRFTYDPDEYQFSRTYKQFEIDLREKIFDWITIDDGHSSMMLACSIMAEKNIRAKIFISSALIGEPGYCTWEQIQELAIFHDIENHSHNHERLSWLQDPESIDKNIELCNNKILFFVGKKPRYFVPPYNNSDYRVEEMAKKNGLILVKNRIDILNSTP